MFSAIRHKQFLFHCQRQLRAVATAAGQATGPVYELRIYSVKPKKFGIARQLLAEKFHTRLKYSRPLGFWITELGGIFQTVHIWPYESVSQRAAVRQALAADKEWQNGFLAEFLPCAQVMDNTLLAVHPESTLKTDFIPSASAVYELLSVPDRKGHVAVSLSDRDAVVGRFTTVFGPVGNEYVLFRYPDPDTAFTQAAARNEKGRIEGYSRFMMPHDLSQLK